MITLVDDKNWYWELQPLLPYKVSDRGLTEIWCQSMDGNPDSLYGYSAIPIPVFTDWWKTDEHGAQPLLA